MAIKPPMTGKNCFQFTAFEFPQQYKRLSVHCRLMEGGSLTIWYDQHSLWACELFSIFFIFSLEIIWLLSTKHIHYLLSIFHVRFHYWFLVGNILLWLVRDQPQQERKAQHNLASIVNVVMGSLNKRVKIGPKTVMFTKHDW